MNLQKGCQQFGITFAAQASSQFFGIWLMKLNIRYYRSLVKRCKNSLDRFIVANRPVKENIFKPKDKRINAIGMQIARATSCQKFWIG